MGIKPNDQVQDVVANLISDARAGTVLAVEMIASYGMPVGREVFDTCVWVGRFVERWAGPHRLVYRKDIKLHLCGSPRAKDPHVRQALLDRFGPGKAAAVGVKGSPGPLYGVSTHLWAALAVAVYAADTAGGAETARRATTGVTIDSRPVATENVPQNASRGLWAEG